MNKTIDKKTQELARLCKKEGYSFIGVVVNRKDNETLASMSGDESDLAGGLGIVIKEFSKKVGITPNRLLVIIKKSIKHLDKSIEKVVEREKE